MKSEREGDRVNETPSNQVINKCAPTLENATRIAINTEPIAASRE
jgi:hypothetical protein